MRAPWPAETATCAAVVSSWLASVAPSRRASATAAASWRGAVPGLQVDHPRDVRRELGLGHRPAAGGVVAQLVDVGELPLAGRVVHQADDADVVLGAEVGELVLERLGADLGAQVQQVADAQRARVAQAPIAVASGRA